LTPSRNAATIALDRSGVPSGERRGKGRLAGGRTGGKVKIVRVDVDGGARLKLFSTDQEPGGGRPGLESTEENFT
jgi:hypothetical protein